MQLVQYLALNGIFSWSKLFWLLCFWWKLPEIVVSLSQHFIGGGGDWRRNLNIWDICSCIVCIVSHIVQLNHVQHNARQCRTLHQTLLMKNVSIFRSKFPNSCKNLKRFHICHKTGHKEQWHFSALTFTVTQSTCDPSLVGHDWFQSTFDSSLVGHHCNLIHL